MPKNGFTKQTTEKLIGDRSELIRILYENGFCLDDICRKTKLDIDSVLDTIRKNKYKRKELYLIYEYQEEKNISKKVRMEIRQRLTEKFFPVGSGNELFSHSYYLYFKENLKRQEKLKSNCSHSTCHIACGICGKILADASEIYQKIKDK